jgi:hypothetical protein
MVGDLRISYSHKFCRPIFLFDVAMRTFRFSVEEIELREINDGLNDSFGFIQTVFIL